MKVNNIKGISSVDLLVVKDGSLIKSIDNYITKKDYKKEIKLYIKADKGGFGSGTFLNISLYKSKDDKKRLLSNEKIELVEGAKWLELFFPLKEFIKGDYQYEIEDESSKEKDCSPFSTWKGMEEDKKVSASINSSPLYSCYIITG